jgi:hypothetical protein
LNKITHTITLFSSNAVIAFAMMGHGDSSLRDPTPAMPGKKGKKTKKTVG